MDDPCLALIFFGNALLLAKILVSSNDSSESASRLRSPVGSLSVLASRNNSRPHTSSAMPPRSEEDRKQIKGMRKLIKKLYKKNTNLLEEITVLKSGGKAGDGGESDVKIDSTYSKDHLIYIVKKVTLCPTHSAIPSVLYKVGFGNSSSSRRRRRRSSRCWSSTRQCSCSRFTTS